METAIITKGYNWVHKSLFALYVVRVPTDFFSFVLHRLSTVELAISMQGTWTSFSVVVGQ